MSAPTVRRIMSLPFRRMPVLHGRRSGVVRLSGVRAATSVRPPGRRASVPRDSPRLPYAGPERRVNRESWCAWRQAGGSVARQIGSGAPMHGHFLAGSGPRRPACGARAQAGRVPTSSRTASAERSKATRSSAVSSISKTRSRPFAPRTTGNADEQPVDAEFALEQDGAGQDALPVEQDRLDHLEGAGGRSVERRTRLEQGDDLGATVGGPLAQRLDPLGTEQLGDRHAGDGRVTRQRDHRVAVTAEDERVGILDRHAQLLGDERPEAGRVEDPAIPRTRSRGKPDALSATWHIASSGLVTTIRIASGEWRAACSTTDRTIPAFLASRSSRLMPGWRASPYGTTTMSLPAVSA